MKTFVVVQKEGELKIKGDSVELSPDAPVIEIKKDRITVAYIPIGFIVHEAQD